jgi:hypothetical protein
MSNVYRKNLRAWEQWSRLLLGAAGIGVALLVPMAPWILVAVIVGAAGLGATGIVGYCPACALAGREAISRRG